MTEIVSKRQRNSKTFIVDGTHNKLEVSAGPVHFKDALENWQDIDNSLNVSAHVDYDYENGLNDFKVYFKNNLKSSGAIRFEKEDSSVDITIKGISLYDESQDKETLFKVPNNTPQPSINGRKIVFSDAYPDLGIEFGYILQPTGIKEYVEIYDVSNIPDPTTLGYDPDFTYLFLITELDHNADIVEDEYGEISEDRDPGAFSFKKNNKIHFYSPELYGFDSSSSPVNHKLKKKVKIQGKKITLHHGTKYTDIITSTVFPYVVDASIAVDITAGEDDGFEISQNNWDGSANITIGNEFGKGDIPYDAAFRFLNITIANGATIDTAIITLISNQTQADNLDTRIKGVDEDSCAVWADTVGGRPSGRVTTTATEDWTIGAKTPGSSHDTDDFAPIIKEIVDRGGWSSGNDIGIIIENLLSGSEVIKYFESYEEETYDPAKLTVTYTIGGGAVAPTAVLQGPLGGPLSGPI